MSGHSKWSKIKHQKATTDQVKGKLFTKLTNAIIISIREGGGIADPSANFKLRLAIEKARENNMPKEKIDRAVERAIKGGEAGSLTQVIYEAFTSPGVGVLIEAATDNKQRTVSAIKNILDHGGGVLASSGAVSHLFDYVGELRIPSSLLSYDGMLTRVIEAGGEDLEEEGENYVIYTKATELHKVKQKLLQSGLTVSSAELVFRPKSFVEINEASLAKKIISLLSALEEEEDVQHVYANFNIPDAFLE